MAVASMSQLGPYSLHEAVGAGGMGQVYRATDTRLGRTVAIKILHASADRPVRRVRFEQEARAASRLNHPHICALYDVGDVDGQPFLVMEYVEGETLARRLRRGPMTVAEVVRYGIEIADALDHVHIAGLVHRDLKAANVMLTHAGAKLLDFGVAQWTRDLESPSTDPNVQADTITEEGTVVGTVANMSPEQLMGHEADARSDIFALGALLYEMATAQPAFDGPSKAHVIAAVLERDPGRVSDARRAAMADEGTPRWLDEIVARCLAKDSVERWQSARDVRHALLSVAPQGRALAAPDSAVPDDAARRRWRIAIALVLAAAVAAITTTLLWGPPATESSTEPVSVVRSAIVLPPGVRLSRRFGPDYPLAVSADGRRIVYVAAGPDRDQLYVRDLRDLEARPISGTTAASAPFFSPDGRWVAFFAGGALQRVAVAGGPPQRVCDAPGTGGGTWTPDDTIVFAGTGGLLRVRATGGTAERIDGTEGGLWPEVLPDGKTVLFTRATSIDVVALDRPGVRSIARVRGDSSGDDVAILGEGTISQARFLSSGHIVYGQDPGALRAIPFDTSALRATGLPVPLVEGVYRASNVRSVYFAVSRSGLLVYAPDDQRRSLAWVDREGRPTPISADSAPLRIPRLSPDGSRVAVAVDGDTRRADVWIYDLASGARTRLTTAGHNLAIAWSPDGETVIHSSGRDLVSHSVDGRPPRIWLQHRPPELTDRPLYSSSWSRDARSLLFWTTGATTGQDVWVLENDVPRPLLSSAANEKFGMFSPDGRWIAYQSDETGRDEVYVVRYPSLSSKFAVSNRGGGYPVWSSDGRELFYRQGTAMMVAGIKTEPSFRAEAPRVLFDDPTSVGTGGDLRFDVSSDGRRFLTPRSEDAFARDQLVVVQNWTEELRHLTPIR